MYICTETCLSDVKRMEPIDGINRVHKVKYYLEFFFVALPVMLTDVFLKYFSIVLFIYEI